MKGKVIPNPRVATRYAAGATALLAPAMLTGGWGWLLLWPALSFAMVAAGYVWLGGGVYRKRKGRVALPAACLLAPARFGQWLSWVWYRHQALPWNEVAPGLWIGRKPTRKEARTLVDRGVGRVLDLTAEFSEPPELRALDYLNLPVPDLTAPTPAQMNRGTAFVLEGLEKGQTVYIHCKVGYSRSAAVAARVLVETGHCPGIPAAFQHLRETRPGIVIRPEIHNILNP